MKPLAKARGSSPKTKLSDFRVEKKTFLKDVSPIDYRIKEGELYD